MSEFYTNFKCPICGSYKFGTSYSSNGIITRHCHGRGCKYSAPESDDHKHFTHISDEYGNIKPISNKD